MAKILIVDDEAAIADLIQLTLTQAGHECETAMSGNEAADKLEKGRYDLVLLDEPTAAMDMETTLLSEKLIVEYVQEFGCALVLVTHSLQQARRIADEVWYFHKGVLLEAGAKEQVLTEPKMAETRQFLEFYGV